jgi:3-methylcrotonyl-CoA carboxylase alpha subunit
MFSSVLIANRGEIAVRIARTAKRLGLRTIAVYSEADKDALHVALCDEAHLIGPAPPRASYLDIGKILAVARIRQAGCVHPGYGFLAENPNFAEACAAAGIAFIGPPAPAMRAMGLKDGAKALMAKAGVPILPGYHGERQDAAFLKEKAYEIGYPVLIKPVAGGGGKGMRRVDRHAEFDAALAGAMREALSAFGDARVLVEKYVTAPRHVEIQVFADAHGNVIHLNERDCSLQRRHQKVIEEAPAPGMTAELRALMGRAAVEAARAVGYVGAGTVEFIAEGAKDLSADGFWFLEMNTRLQVEHPVTEAITGLDLVEWQFRVAAGEALPLTQDEVPLVGHAVEARLYAEDPAEGFLPSTGRLVALDFPAAEGIRIDTGVAAGGDISAFYDPMIAKIIAHAPTRGEALDRLAAALERTIVAGPRTNLGLLAALCRAGEFREGRFDTEFIDRHLAQVLAARPPRDLAAAAAGVARLVAREAQRLAMRRDPEAPVSPWDADDAFQLAGARSVSLPILLDGESAVAQVVYGTAGATGGPRVSVDGVAAAPDALAVEAADAVYVLRAGHQTTVRLRDVEIDVEHLDGDGLVRAPMHGRLLAVLVDVGAEVHKGQRLAVIEAMKMEHSLLAPVSGKVIEIAAAAGAQVGQGARIMEIEPYGHQGQ